MNKLFVFVTKTMAIAALMFSTAVFAIAPDNPSFEDALNGWTVLPGQQPGSGFIVSGGDATDGTEFARLSFTAWIGSATCGWTETGPILLSPTFPAGAGEVISVDWRNWGTEDQGLAYARLVDSGGNTTTIFDNVATPVGYGANTGWLTDNAVVPADGFYFLKLQVASYDGTYGCLIGAMLDVDHVTSSNHAPDCSAATASKEMLWPPNHKFKGISVEGVTDPDGDMIHITVDSVWQDEPVNMADDGNTCPDAVGIGTDTASVRAERQGGEIGFQSDGRVYRINFTADDGFFGSTCSGTVLVGVPLDKDTPIIDGGPLYNSAPATCP